MSNFLTSSIGSPRRSHANSWGLVWEQEFKYKSRNIEKLSLDNSSSAVV